MKNKLLAFNTELHSRCYYDVITKILYDDKFNKINENSESYLQVINHLNTKHERN